MSPADILVIGAVVAEHQPTPQNAVREALAFVSRYPDAMALLEAAARPDPRVSVALSPALRQPTAHAIAEVFLTAAGGAVA